MSLSFFITASLVLRIVLGTKLLAQNTPLLTHTFAPPKWQKLTDISSNELPAFYSSNLDAAAHLGCEAPYPITWNLSGFTYPTEAIHVPPYFSHRNFTSNNFTIALEIDFSSAQQLRDAGSSIRISCERVGKAEQNVEVFMFVNGRDQSPFVSLQDTTVLDSMVIPCSSKKPSPGPTLLKRRVDGQYDVVWNSSIAYHPTVGFLSDNVFDGIYMCTQDPYYKTITAAVSGEYIVRPATKVVFAFSDEIIQLECSSRSQQQLDIVVDVLTSSSINILHKTTTNQTIVQLWVMYQNTSGLNGKAQCIAIDRGVTSNFEVVTEWEFEFLPAPLFRIDNHFQEIQCLSDARERSLQTVRCWNPVDCIYRSRCLTGVSSCNIKGQKQHNSSLQKTCWVEEIKENRNCTTVPFTHFSGLAQCTVNGMMKQWEYFVGYNGMAYTDWREAKQSELIQISEIKNLTSGISTFMCKAVTYLFSNNLKFEIKFKNDSKHFLDDNRSTVNITSLPDWTELTITSLLEMFVPKETLSINCHAGWWNETGTIYASIEFATPQYETTPGDSSTLYLILTVTVSVVLFVVIALWYQSRRRNLTDTEINDFFQGRPELLTNAVDHFLDTVEFVPYNTAFEIPLQDLKFETSDSNFLGRGNFSYVIRGTVLSKSLPVAIKIPLPSDDVNMFKTLLSEVKIMTYVGQHQNVIALIGVCTEGIRDRSVYIISEICESGSLNKYLQNARPVFINILNTNQKIDRSLVPLTIKTSNSDFITTLDLIKFSAQIAKGMEYLSSKSVIHADLAARNVLLTKDKIIKISDFGLSKRLYESLNYVKKSKTPLPWRWMAIESLKTSTFSTASDVWSYGVTLFEIFTLGDTPFAVEEWNKDFIVRLERGMRMGRPKYSTLEIYSVMVSCWEHDPVNRPTFRILRVFFENMVDLFIERQNRLSSYPNTTSDECNDGEKNNVSEPKEEETYLNLEDL